MYKRLYGKNVCLRLKPQMPSGWKEVLQSDPLITFFENIGFKISEKSQMAPFNQPSCIMILFNKCT